MKLYNNHAGNIYTNVAAISANLAKVQYEEVFLNEEQIKEKEWKVKNLTGKFPLLETADGALFESAAIARYFARLGDSGLYGANAWESAQADQWADYGKSVIYSKIMPIYMAVFGQGQAPEEKTYTDAVKDIKEAVKLLNTHLAGKEWLVGGRVTIADIVVGVSLVLPFQTILDGGFRKAMGNTTAWLERFCKLPEVVSRLGHVKFVAKAFKPILAVKAKEEKKEAPKAKEEGEEVKPVNPIDLLPPTTFDLFAFKTYFVNLAQDVKKADGMKFFLENYDREGYCIFYCKYDKCEGEGVVLYQTANNLNGFLQRCDSFRRITLGSHCILGEEPALDIEGVWLFRGKIIPQEMHDNPQFEYYKNRELSIDNAEDVKLISDFWCVKQGDQINGRTVQECKLHK